MWRCRRPRGGGDEVKIRGSRCTISTNDPVPTVVTSCHDLGCGKGYDMPVSDVGLAFVTLGVIERPRVLSPLSWGE